MDTAHVIATLRKFEPGLRARGAWHAALFGSRARGTAGPESDIDIMIEVDPAAGLEVYAYAGLKRLMAELFDGPADVVNREFLRSTIRPPAEAEAVYAFSIS